MCVVHRANQNTGDSKHGADSHNREHASLLGQLPELEMSQSAVTCMAQAVAEQMVFASIHAMQAERHAPAWPTDGCDSPSLFIS